MQAALGRGEVKDERPAANTRGLRLHQSEHQLHRDRSVHRRAAALEDVVPGIDGERMRCGDHVATAYCGLLRRATRCRLGHGLRERDAGDGRQRGGMDEAQPPGSPVAARLHMRGTISSATMLMILISGFTAGPAVSLYGSPTVSPVTAALWASEPLPPWWPSSMYFLALSQAPPPVVIEIATNRPVTIVPMSTPPSACVPRSSPIRIGISTGSRLGMIISLIAARVSMSTAVPYSGFALPSMIPLISLNCRRTSITTAPAARPTASIAIAPNRYGTMPPMNRPTITMWFDRSNDSDLPACSRACV